MRLILIFMIAILSSPPAWAAPRHYALDKQSSSVGFAWDFGKDEVRGRMPVTRADLTIDFAKVENSQVDVAVDVTGAEAGFPFASQAMKGPKILDAGHFPQIRFVSKKVRAVSEGAMIEGDITVRGVTRPMALAAQIYRQRGTDPNDLTHLVIQLTGALNRSEFGATGWSDLAGDQVRLSILAYIEEQG